MAVPQIDQLPTPPNRQDATNFSARTDAFLMALAALFPTQANAIATFVNQMATQAAASAASAINAPGTSATSTTQLTIGSDPKTFAIQTGKAFVVGQFVTAAQTSAPGNWLVGQVTAHDPNAGSLTIQPTATAGAGQISDWTIGLSSPMQFLPALAADLWAGVDNIRPVTSAALLAAQAGKALVDQATITPDFAQGQNFTLTLGGARTLANPANAQQFDSGVIVITQDGNGGRSLAYGSAWKFPGGVVPLTQAANAIDTITYLVISPTLILARLSRAFA